MKRNRRYTIEEMVCYFEGWLLDLPPEHKSSASNHMLQNAINMIEDEEDGILPTLERRAFYAKQ